MTISPSGMTAALSTTPGASCDTAPPPLVGGGNSPIQSPLQVPVQLGGSGAVLGTGALGAPVTATPVTTGATAATTGATTLGSVDPGAATLGGSAPVAITTPAPITLPVAPAADAVPLTTALPAPVTPIVSTTAAAAPGAARLTSLAPGAQQSDADLVEGALAALRQSPSGAQVVDRLLAVGARINVLSDQELADMGYGDAHAVFDPKLDTMFLRRSDLADTTNRGFAAVALAHEGTHLLDDAAGLDVARTKALVDRIIAAGGPSSAAGAEAQRQGEFELTMIKEARAFTFSGQVARELGVALPASDPTSVAIAGANDQATYAQVFQALLGTGYNPERRTAAVQNF